MSAGRLLRAVRDAGVSAATGARIGKPGVRATWEIFYDGTETPTDLVTAQGVIDTIDLEGDVALDPELDANLSDEHAVIALREALFDGLGVAPSDRVVIRQDHRARYRTLVKGS